MATDDVHSAATIAERIAALVERERGKDANKVTVRYEDPAKLRAEAGPAPVTTAKPGIRSRFGNRTYDRTCGNPECGKDFVGKAANARYCCPECMARARELRLEEEQREAASTDASPEETPEETIELPAAAGAEGPGEDESPDGSPSELLSSRGEAGGRAPIGDTRRQIRSALAAGCLTTPSICAATGLRTSQVGPIVRRMVAAETLFEDGFVPSERGGPPQRRFALERPEGPVPEAEPEPPAAAVEPEEPASPDSSPDVGDPDVGELERARPQLEADIAPEDESSEDEQDDDEDDDEDDVAEAARRPDPPREPSPWRSVERTCGNERCDNRFLPEQPNHDYCSQDCRDEEKRRRAGQRPMADERVCTRDECDNTFTPTHPRQDYCSALCRDEVRRAKDRAKSARQYAEQQASARIAGGLDGSPDDSPASLQERYLELLFLLAERDGTEHVLSRLEKIVAASSS